MIKLQVRGLRELDEQLKEIDRKLGLKALINAGRKAFKPTLQTARARAPEDTGLLRRRIKIRVVKTKKGKGFIVGVGLIVGKSPKGVDGKNARNWSWYERGIPARGIAATPFFRAALESNASVILSTLKAELAVEISKITPKGPRV